MRNIVSLAAAAGAFGAIIWFASDTAAYELRVPGIACQGVNAGLLDWVPPDAGVGAGAFWYLISTQGNVFINGAPVGSGDFYGVTCPFTDDVLGNKDTGIENINVDLTNPFTAEVDPVNVVAQACVFSDWDFSCGSTGSPTGFITSGGHASIALTTSAQLGVWQDDSGGGYAFVNVEAANSVNIAVQGIYYH